MTIPILDRLRNMANEPTTSFGAAALMRESVEEIDQLTRERAQPNPGQALFDENTKLRAAINAMATDAMWIAQINEGPNTGAWQWILLYETDWHGVYPTPLEAALAGVEKGAQ